MLHLYIHLLQVYALLSSTLFCFLRQHKSAECFKLFPSFRFLCCCPSMNYDGISKARKTFIMHYHAYARPNKCNAPCVENIESREST